MGEKRLLPLVSETVEETIKAELLSGKEQYVSDLINKIKEENPVIIYFIADYIKGLKNNGEEDPAAINAAIYSGIFVYKLLESQAEADQLEKDIFNQ
ncbi:hypothetical protein HY837_02920 [archaeon]|nr:hypothetical protein [archaeon]